MMDHYVSLVTMDELDTATLKSWCTTARSTLQGIATTHTTMKDGTVVNAVLVKRKADSRFHYLIPLSRDLFVEEAAALSKAVAFDFEYDIEASQPEPTEAEDDRLFVSKNDMEELCTSLAKERHETWVKDRTQAGWRFGETFSTKNMTHPLLRPWEQIPEDKREIDTKIVPEVIAFLSRQGYSVVANTEVEKFNKALRTHGIRIDPLPSLGNDEST